ISILNIETNYEVKQAIVYSILGAEILRTQQRTIDISGLAQGIFLIKVEDIYGNRFTKKFIKK
ncbi:T9SS type A sorting domain-containing protein, partial [Psychroserpens damuponensis]|uniref:T9SS type A sorting domain-containing protein n=1 Tax=Psychroserpens damuponensis TaxID=943936 RepID=UPI00059089D6